MKVERQKLLKRLEKMTDSDVYVLFTASAEMQYAINATFIPIYTRAIYSRRKKRRNNAIVVLETDGGSGPAVMSLVSQLRECYENVDAYIFNRCYSAGTVGAFAADKIYMSKYAFLGPVDTQFYVRQDGVSIKPLIANFHAFNNRVPDAREAEFAAKYPEEYLMAITDLNYDFQVIFPNFVNHFEVPECLTNDGEVEDSEEVEEFEDRVTQAWEYFDGGVGEHSANINRTKARELGLVIYDMPDEIEEILFDIIDSYVSDTNMMVDSVSILEEKDAYFETVGSSYVHYYLYEKIQQELDKETADDEEDDEEEGEEVPAPVSPKTANKRMLIAGKYCTERGWKQE